MSNFHYVKYGTLSGFLLVCAIILSTNADNLQSIYAQITPAAAGQKITPAPEAYGGKESVPSSSSNNDHGDDGNAGSKESPDSKDDTEAQDAIVSEEGSQSPEKEVTNSDIHHTNSLLEKIMNEVMDDITVTGITGLG